jgi:hypothetical protein
MPGSHYDWLVTLADLSDPFFVESQSSSIPSIPSIHSHSRGLRLGCGMSDWCKALQGSQYKIWPMEAGWVEQQTQVT